MRFRTNIDNVLTFQRILQSIEKLQKRCIVRFTETEMHIICNSESEDGVQVWSQIKVDSLFTNYRIQSNADNVITISLSPEALLQALKSAYSQSSSTASIGGFSLSADDVVMKLAKKNGRAVLSVEIAGTGSGGGRAGHVLVAHDVLIDVLRPADLDKLKEPMCPPADVHIVLPPLQKLRTVAEHMRQLADVLTIQANHAGDLRLSVDTDEVKVDTQWTKCVIPNMTTDEENANANNPDNELEPPEREDKSQPHSVLLSVRSFLKFLSCHVVSTTTIASICENHCMILYVYIGAAGDTGGVLTFYIPARLSGVEV